MAKFDLVRVIRTNGKCAISHNPCGEKTLFTDSELVIRPFRTRWITPRNCRPDFSWTAERREGFPG